MLVDQAVHALSAQRVVLCEQLCAKIESIHPGDADAANILGIIRVQAGDVKSGEALLLQAAQTSPRRPEFHDNLGKLYLSLKLYSDAVACYANALQYNPDSLQIKLGYCTALVPYGESDKALPILQALHDQLPKNTDVMMGLFSTHYHLHRYEDAMAFLDAVIARSGRHFEAHFQKAQVLMQQGNMEQAEVEFRIALSIQPDHAAALANLADLKKFRVGDDADLQSMQELYVQSEPGSPDRVHLCFALAKAYEELKQFDQAFEYYKEGNEVRHAHSTFNLDAELAHLQVVTAFYTPDALSRISGLEDERPIFVVGLPRCGSTLTEQILASHPDVASRGEWNAFDRVLYESRNLENPLTLEEMTGFSSEQWRGIGQAYLDRLDEGPKAKRITDKTLINFRLIGAIHCALPRARIVHVRRHPLDNCLAIYRANLEGDDFDFGYDLESLAHYCRMYQQVMQHWRNVLPEGVMYELHYEKLVANQEGETRKLITACGLPWDDACLRFTEADTMVSTSSVTQVRKGMYTDSVARWKCYEKHLQPLIHILGEV